MNGKKAKKLREAHRIVVLVPAEEDMDKPIGELVPVGGFVLIGGGVVARVKDHFDLGGRRLGVYPSRRAEAHGVGRGNRVNRR